MLDPTLREEQVCEGEVIVTANAQGEVCQIKKMGGVPTDALVLLRCVDIAVATVRNHLSPKIRDALDQDARKRDMGGLISAELSAQNAR